MGYFSICDKNFNHYKSSLSAVVSRQQCYFKSLEIGGQSAIASKDPRKDQIYIKMF